MPKALRQLMIENQFYLKFQMIMTAINLSILPYIMRAHIYVIK